MAEDKEKMRVTKNGKLVYTSGTIKKTTDGKRYIVSPAGNWVSLDRLMKKLKDSR